MEFLENLYQNENFGLYLFIIIAILIVLFFIVLFLGKKDTAKPSKKASSAPKEPTENNQPAEQPLNNVANNNPVIENVNPELTNLNMTGPISLENLSSPMNNMENQSINNASSMDAFKQFTLDNQPLDFNAPNESILGANPLNNNPNFNNLNNDNSLSRSNIEVPKINNEIEIPSLENFNIPDSSVEKLNRVPEPIDQPKVETLSNASTKEFDFDALASAISKELETIEHPKKQPEKDLDIPIVEPKINIPTLNFNEPEPILSKKEPKVLEPVIKEEKEVFPTIEQPKKPVMPSVFSSVYVNREVEKKSQPAVSNMVSEKAKPPIDLPKKIELPKKAEVKEEPKETFTLNSVLSNLENDTYHLK